MSKKEGKEKGVENGWRRRGEEKEKVEGGGEWRM